MHHISTRDVIQWARHVKNGFKLGEAYEASIGNKVFDTQEWQLLTTKLQSLNEINPKLELKLTHKAKDIDCLTTKYTMEIEELEMKRTKLSKLCKELELKLSEITKVVATDASTTISTAPTPPKTGRL